MKKMGLTPSPPPPLLAILVLAAVWGLTPSTPRAQSPHAASSTRVPVVVELFTTESSSEEGESSPSTPHLLAQLQNTLRQATPPANDAEWLLLQMQVLSEAGEKTVDEVEAMELRGSAFLSARLGLYADRFDVTTDTPLAVVDGAAAAAGMDVDGVAALIAKAAERPKARVSLSFQNELGLEILVSHPPHEDAGDPLIVWLLAIEEVPAGNADQGDNREAIPMAFSIVRDMAQVGLIIDGDFARRVPVHRRRLANVRWAVLMQSMRSSQIIGAAVIDHPPAETRKLSTPSPYR